jgi:nucleoside-diphosphate-sugar epimerase
MRPHPARMAVTGGSGRVGRAIAAAAADDGYEVVVVDRQPPPPGLAGRVSFRAADLTDHDATVAALDGCDVLVHLAALPSPRAADEVVVHDTNVLSSYHALAAAAQLGIGRAVQASSINAVGATWSRWPRYDYLPVDEDHPTYNEDAYSLSKWLAEAQADSLTRRYDGFSVASLRLHAFVHDRQEALDWAAREGEEWAARGLWGYTTAAMLADACLRSCRADFRGHQAFFIAAPDTAADAESAGLHQRWFPDVPLRQPLTGRDSFWDCGRATRVLGWTPLPSATEGAVS